MRRRPRPTKRKNSARGAEVIPSRSRVPLVHGKLVERRQETEAGLFDSMSQRASFPADAAVTEANVVEVRIDLEANLSAVARSSVGLHRSILVLLGFCQ